MGLVTPKTAACHVWSSPAITSRRRKGPQGLGHPRAKCLDTSAPPTLVHQPGSPQTPHPGHPSFPQPLTHCLAFSLEQASATRLLNPVRGQPRRSASMVSAVSSVPPKATATARRDCREAPVLRRCPLDLALPAVDTVPEQPWLLSPLAHLTPPTPRQCGHTSLQYCVPDLLKSLNIGRCGSAVER